MILVRCKGEEINREIEIDVLRATQPALSTWLKKKKKKKPVKQLPTHFRGEVEDRRIKPIGQVCPSERHLTFNVHAYLHLMRAGMKI